MEALALVLLADVVARHIPTAVLAHGEPQCPVCRVSAPCSIVLEANRLIGKKTEL